MTHPRSSVYLRLVAKDLYLQRGLIVGATAVGAATLALSTKTVHRDWLAARAWLRAEIGHEALPG